MTPVYATKANEDKLYAFKRTLKLHEILSEATDLKLQFRLQQNLLSKEKNTNKSLND